MHRKPFCVGTAPEAEVGRSRPLRRVSESSSGYVSPPRASPLAETPTEAAPRVRRRKEKPLAREVYYVDGACNTVEPPSVVLFPK